MGADPCKSKKGASTFLKTPFESFLEASRENLEVASLLLEGSWIPYLNELTP